MWNRERRVVAAALAAVFAILLPAAVTGAWIRGTILSTSGYVAAVTPVAASPAVHAAVETAVISRVDAALSQAGNSRSPAAGLLAGPPGAWLAGLAKDAVGAFLASQAFQRLWADANRLVHGQVISVLDGDGSLVTVTGGDVVLDLQPLVNDVLPTASGRLPAMTGRAVSLPPVTALPAAACRAGTRTPSSACAKVPLFPAATLARARLVYRILVVMAWLLPALTALAFAGALAASPRRRRTLLQLAVGGTLSVLAVMTAVSLGESSLIGRAGPRYQAITSAFVHALTAGYFTASMWCVAGGLTVTALALLSGPAAMRWLRPALGRARLTTKRPG